MHVFIIWNSHIQVKMIFTVNITNHGPTFYVILNEAKRKLKRKEKCNLLARLHHLDMKNTLENSLN